MSWSEEDLRAHYARLKQRPEGEPLPAPANDSSESMIQAECVKLMEEDGWRALRTDPVSDKSRGKGFGEVGMADVLFMRPGIADTSRRNGWCQILWVEFKSRAGKPKKHQTTWHNTERASGFQTWIASVDFPASVEGFRERYANSGLMRRERWW